MRTTFTSGAWIEHRPVQDLKRKDKRAVASVLRARVPFTEDGQLDLAAGITLDGDLMYEAAAVAAACILTAWSYEAPLPRWDGEAQAVENAGSLDEIPLDDSDEFDKLLAPYTAKLLAGPDPKGNQSATTSASNGSSRARAARSRPG